MEVAFVDSGPSKGRGLLQEAQEGLLDVPEAYSWIFIVELLLGHVTRVPDYKALIIKGREGGCWGGERDIKKLLLVLAGHEVKEGKVVLRISKTGRVVVGVLNGGWRIGGWRNDFHRKAKVELMNVVWVDVICLALEGDVNCLEVVGDVCLHPILTFLLSVLWLTDGCHSEKEGR